MRNLLSALALVFVASTAAALPPGFPQAITAVGNDLTLWGRTYVFDTNCGPFPRATGVVSSCQHQLDGVTLTWSDPELQSNTGELATLTTTATQGNFSVTATTKVDVAGIATIDPVVTNTSGGSDSFSWKAAVTLDAALDVYLNRHVGYDAVTFEVLKGNTSSYFGSYTNGCYEFVPTFEVHDHLKSFEWLLDGDYDYEPDDRDDGCAGDVCKPLCTTDILGAPQMSVEPFPASNQKTLGAGASWSERYIVVVHPTRPTIANWRGLQVAHATQVPGWWRPESESGKRLYNTMFTGNVQGTTPYSGLPRYIPDGNYASALQALKDDSIEALPYGAFHRSFYLHPTYLANRTDWGINASGREGLDQVGDVTGETNCCPTGRNFGLLSHVNVDGDPWQPAWQAPWTSGNSAIIKFCKAAGVPWECCTGEGTGPLCKRSDMAHGLHGFCDNQQDGNDEAPFKASEFISAFLDPRVAADGLYFDHGNLARSCVADPRITNASQQVWFYDFALNFFERIYRAVKANGGPAITASRPESPLMVIHSSGAPRALLAWTDIGSWGETLGDEFGTIGGNGCGFSGCADGACNDGTEACTPYTAELCQGTIVGPTGISQAADAVVKVNAHPFEVDDTVRFVSVSGMTQINGLSATVLSVNANDFTVDLDTSSFSPWTFGGIVQQSNDCGFCPDYVGIGEDTIVAVSRPHSGGTMGSMLAMARDACVDDDDSSSYWARNLWTTWLGVGITHGVASDFAQELVPGCSGGTVPCQNIQRQHASLLEKFGSLFDADLLATYAHENSPHYSTDGGIRLSIYAHPSMTGCVGACDKKALFIVQNWTNANITGASFTISNHAALGLTEGGNAVNCIRTWDPSTVPENSLVSEAQFGPWVSDTSPFTGLNVAAKSYLAIEAKYGATCP
jgi:hypothetical protein